MHIQYSYNSNVSILLVSLLSRASGSLRTTPFHFFKKCFYTCNYYDPYTPLSSLLWLLLLSDSMPCNVIRLLYTKSLTFNRLLHYGHYCRVV